MADNTLDTHADHTVRLWCQTCAKWIGRSESCAPMLIVSASETVDG